MPETYDVIVIGLGAMGSAAAFHCARRGLRVLGLEQFAIPHDLGSSHGHSRMIRLAYYEHPDYVPLLRAAYDAWDELESLSSQKLLHRTGGVYMGPADGEVVPGAVRAAHDHALPHQPLSHADLAKRYPMFRLPDDYIGVFEPAAGFLIPERCVSAHADQALRHGADLRAHEPVLAWSESSRGVTVQTPKATYSAAKVIFTAGPWTAHLLRDLNIPLVVTRQILGWLWPAQDPDRFTLGRFPVWGIEQPDRSLAYGFPIHPEAPGLKLARHAPGTPVDPDAVPRAITPADEAEVRSIIDRFLPTAAGPTLALRTCLYTNSPDHHFLLGPHPAHPNALLAAGFSGHGFKFASIIGRALADLVTGDGNAVLPIGFLSPTRFT